MVDLTRGILVAGAGALLWSWIATAGTGQMSGPAPSPPLPPVQDPAVQDLDRETARLRSRLAVLPAPIASSRDPFRFAERREAAAPDRPVAPAADPADVAPRSLLQLIGVAEDIGPDGPVRTAILSAPGDLLLVRVGDIVLNRYRVTAIEADRVWLGDAEGGLPESLSLR